MLPPLTTFVPYPLVLIMHCPDSAKRYERMMKAHGIHPTNPSAPELSAPTKPKDTAKMEALKKRKLEQFADVPSAAIDDDEGLGRVKNEIGAVPIKDEPNAGGMVYATPEASQYPVLQGNCSGVVGNGGYGSADANAFNEFMQSGAFGQTFVRTDPAPPTFHLAGEQSVFGNLMNGGPKGSPRTANEIILIAD